MKKFVIKMASCLFFIFSLTYTFDDIYPPKGAVIKSEWLKVWIKDFFKLQRYLFTADTLKVLSFTIPAYVGTRRMDENLQCCFYRECCHTNCHQAPKGFYKFIDVSVPVMIGILAGFTFSDDADIRLTSFVYTEAVISYWALKNVFKNCNKCDLNKRPKNGDFCKDTCYYGGFPSGHVGEAALATVLFGLRHGYKWAIPLGIYTGVVLAASINGNRHYLSQTIGGLGLGIIYGLAANAFINSKINCPVDFCVTSGSNGYNGLGISYSF